jgi:murein DD-endopeptidase MepM/ murein hydrolase activator NlpD
MRRLRWSPQLDAPSLWRLSAHACATCLLLAVFAGTHLGATGSVEDAWRAVGLAGLETPMAESVPLAQRIAPKTEHSVDGVGGLESSGFMSGSVLPEADDGLLPWDGPKTYVVEGGDTVIGIAEKHGVEPETILFANPSLRADPHSLSVGDELIILPVNGALHTVAEGDTLQSVAEKFKVDVQALLDYAPNGVSPDSTLVAGTTLVIPGGSVDLPVPPRLPRPRPVVAAGPSRGSGGIRVPVGSIQGTGSWARAAYGRITSGFRRWHPGVDIANGYGSAIYAVDSGVVEFAGWHPSGYGYSITINHGNGYKSFYAHLQRYYVSYGQAVGRGQVIGEMGCSRGRGGRCTGPHLHLEMFFNGGRFSPCNAGQC